MAIRSDNRPDVDSSSWLREKSLFILRDACFLVDIFRMNKEKLPKCDLENARERLFGLIHDAVKIVTFAYEDDQYYSDEWINLMFTQGSERYSEFEKRVNGEISFNQPPHKYPISIYESLNLLDEIEKAIRENEEEITIRRCQILKSGRKLKKSKHECFVSIGNKLEELVDDQTCYAGIDWPEFCSQVLSVIKIGRNKAYQEGEKSITPWI